MKDENRTSDNPVQDLLHAVVVRAAEDYREAKVKMMIKPKSAAAGKTAKECRDFFLSPEFSAYTTVEGRFILEKLDQELDAFKVQYADYLKTEAEMLQEAREAARLYLRKRELEHQMSLLEKQFDPQHQKVHDLILKLRDQQMEMPAYARKQLPYPMFVSVMLKACADLKEDIIDGKEKLWD